MIALSDPVKQYEALQNRKRDGEIQQPRSDRCNRHQYAWKINFSNQIRITDQAETTTNHCGREESPGEKDRAR